MLLSFFLACTGKDGDETVTVDSVDTGLPDCGRVRGTRGVMMYTEGDVIHAPVDAADTEISTHGIAGPVGDDMSFVISVGGRVQATIDGGCNWENVGSLPGGGWWDLLASGSRTYAFDRNSTSGARSDDLGRSWQPFDVGGTFIGMPTIDPVDTNRVRGVQARGVVTTTDGGDTWPVTGTVPADAGTIHDARGEGSDLEQMVVGVDLGVRVTRNGGTSWEDVTMGLPVAKAGVPMGARVAISPADPAVFFAESVDGSLISVSRSPDRGATWERVVSSDQTTLDVETPLWPVPTNSAQVQTAAQTGTDGCAISLHTIEVGIGTHTLSVGTYCNMPNLVFGADRTLAAVDGVE